MCWTKMKILFIFITLLSCCYCRNYSYVVFEDKTIKYVSAPSINKKYLAKAYFENDIERSGWAFLEVRTNKMYSNEQQALAAGYIEGYLTRDLIWMHWQNVLKGYCYNKTDVCEMLDKFIDKNMQWLQSVIKENPLDEYYHQVSLVLSQLKGIVLGYANATIDEHQALSFRDIYWINALGDLDELCLSFIIPKVDDAGLLFGRSDHCSGLVKLLPDKTDLLVGHTTWTSFNSMLRIHKKYVFEFTRAPKITSIIPGRVMVFSSYPALLHSMDDFIATESGLVISETTTANSNRTLYQNISPIGQLFSFIRSIVANRLSNSGGEWIKIFRKHNSGTYNNQWFVVDYKQFQPGTNTTDAIIKPGLLWVIEQLPGLTESGDLTKLLLEKSYFPSFNINYFERMFNLSGGQMRIKMFGDWFSYEGHPRYKIFERDQKKVCNIVDMFRLMRENNYKFDPLSRCEQCKPPYSGCNAIAARNDLNPPNGTFPFKALSHRNHGAIDAKVINVELLKKFKFLAVSSPPYNVSKGIPPFKWSETDFHTVSHVGHPDLWMFDPVIHTFLWDDDH